MPCAPWPTCLPLLPLPCQAAVSRLTRDCDELSKKLYWAELARDQTKAAKELAAEDMIKSRWVCVGGGVWAWACGCVARHSTCQAAQAERAVAASECGHCQ
jgi:hypothetical protein